MKIFYNRVALIGELVDAPKLQSFDDGNSSAALRVRVEKGYVTKEGEVRTSQLYVRCFAGGKIAAAISTDVSLVCGSFVTIEGALRSYKRKDETWEMAVDVIAYRSNGVPKATEVKGSDYPF